MFGTEKFSNYSRTRRIENEKRPARAFRSQFPYTHLRVFQLSDGFDPDRTAVRFTFHHMERGHRQLPACWDAARAYLGARSILMGMLSCLFNFEHLNGRKTLAQVQQGFSP